MTARINRKASNGMWSGAPAQRHIPVKPCTRELVSRVHGVSAIHSNPARPARGPYRPPRQITAPITHQIRPRPPSKLPGLGNAEACTGYQHTCRHQRRESHPSGWLPRAGQRRMAPRRHAACPAITPQQVKPGGVSHKTTWMTPPRPPRSPPPSTAATGTAANPCGAGSAPPA
jgi:hypothetical protein